MMRLYCPVCHTMLGQISLIPSEHYEEGCSTQFENEFQIEWTMNADLLNDKLVVCKVCGFSYDISQDEANVPILINPYKRKKIGFFD